MSTRNKIQKTYVGTDGIHVRGHAVKARKRLEQRQRQYERMITYAKNESGMNPDGMTCPGSMTK